MKDFNLGMSATTEQLTESYSLISQSVRDNLVRLGVLSAQQEECCILEAGGVPYEGVLPRNLEELPNDDIVEFMVAVTERTGFINGLISDAEVRKLEMKELRQAIASRITAERGKECIYSDLRYVEVNASFIEWECNLIYLDGALKRESKNYQALSRIVSVRGQDHDMNARAENTRRGWPMK